MAALQAKPEKPPFYADKMKMLVVLDAEGNERPVTDVRGWKLRRDHILANLQEVMGPLPPAAKKVPLAMEVLEEEKLERVTRKKITFAAEKGDRVPAYLLIPNKLRGKTAAMLCLHQTIEIGKSEPAGLGGSPNLHYALELAERGYVTLAPDYPNFGDYRFVPYEHGYVSATMKGIWNHMRAVDLLQSLPEVDRERIGGIGHSLGGHNTLFVAAFDPRIKAMVSSCGFNAFPKYMQGDLSGWSHNGYMPRIREVYGCDPKRMPWDFTEVVSALAPRPLFVNAPLKDDNFDVTGVRDCMTAALPVYRLLGVPEALVAHHPDSGHDFPPAVREAAYAFLDAALRR